MSQDPHHSRKGYHFCADRGNHRGQTDHPSAFVSGQTDGDSVVILLSHALSSGTVEPQHMRLNTEERKLDCSCDPAHGNPQPEADPESLVFGKSQQKRTLRRKPRCGDLRAKAAYQANMKEPEGTVFAVSDGSEWQAVNISLPQPIRDSPTCVAPEPPGQERDPKDGRRTRRGHRAAEKPLSPIPSLKTFTDSQVETEPRNESNHDPRCAGHMGQQSNSRPDAQAESHVQAQGAGFLTSQEWQQHPTTHGPGSPYEIARTLHETTQSREPILHAEEETTSNASTLVAETPFDPIAGLEGFDGVSTMRGEGYHYSQAHRHSPTSPLEEDLLAVAAAKDVPSESRFAEETLLQNVPAHVLRAGNVARVRRGYPASSSSYSAGCSDDEVQQEIIRARVPDFTLIPAFEEYSIPAFSWQRRSSRMTEDISRGLRQLALSLCDCLYEIDW